MPLTAGTQLGPYEIVAAIGAGGMGEVYRARDARLARDVAIKVLPGHLAADEAARARFEREARAVAALSHPNILAVHDVGVHHDTTYVVMELLEGETLRARLSPDGGAPVTLPIRKVTQIGIEIANGLAAAHDKQIVHRDLKPENVFIAADGHVKLLDFGLARQLSSSASKSTDAPTELRHTDPGTVMGTVGYMAPEQVKGLAVDARADIFSLGCVLYEMASGRRAFARDTTAETMTAILRDDPPELVREGGAIPAAFEPIVRHCLEKRPDERFQSARDLAFALHSLASSSGISGTATTTPAPVGAGTVVVDRPAPRRGWVAAAVITLGLAAAFAAGRFTAPPGAIAGRPAFTMFRQVSDFPGVETWPSLSPDGKTVVYAGDGTGQAQIYSLRIGGRTAVALTSGSTNATPALSADGERIAFWSDRDGGGIFLMNASGESVTRVTDEGFTPAWSPDGREIVLSRGTFASPADLGSSAPGLFAINLQSGQKREVTTATSALQPAWSPHGHRIAYFGLRANTGQRDIYTVAADGSQVDKPAMDVTNDPALDWSPSWSPAGDYLYFSSNRGGTMNLWRVPIDEPTGRVLGEPEPVTTPSSWGGMISFSRDGHSMAFASLDWRSTLLRQGFDAARETLVGAPVPVLKGTRPIRDHDVSPDGRWVTFNESAPQEDILVARIDGSEYRRLTDDIARDRGPVWAPDGSRIVFYSDRSGSYHLWSIRPDGSQLQQLSSGAGSNFATWSPDGRRLAYAGINAGGFFIVDADSKASNPPAPEPEFRKDTVFWPFSWSADGARLLGSLRSPGGRTIDMVAYDVRTKQYQVLKVTGPTLWQLPLWLADGRRFLLRTEDNISVMHPDTGKATQLLPVRGYAIGRSLGLSRDNTFFTYTETGTEGEIWIAMMGNGRGK